MAKPAATTRCGLHSELLQRHARVSNIALAFAGALACSFKGLHVSATFCSDLNGDRPITLQLRFDTRVAGFNSALGCSIDGFESIKLVLLVRRSVSGQHVCVLLTISAA